MIGEFFERHQSVFSWTLIALIIFAPPLWKRARRRLRSARGSGRELHGARLPFEGEWHVFWGGDNASENHHHDSDVQRYAFDFVIAPTGDGDQTFQGSGESNTDYFCFGREILAPLPGTVVCAVDGIDDNVPSEMNEQMVYGNTVMIEHSGGLVSVLAHLRKHSIRVKEGDSVHAGEVIGQCGNSGNSSEPHLHFHVQDKAGFEQGHAAKVFFEHLRERTKGDLHGYSPVKGDGISSPDANATSQTARMRSQSASA